MATPPARARPRRPKSRLLSSLAAAAVTLAPAAALADDAPKRWIGFGGTLGFGVAGLTTVGFSSNESGVVVPYPDITSLEIQAFNRFGHSIDVSVPLVNTIIQSAIIGGFIWQTDVFYNFNLGPSWVRFVVGPGLGARFGAVGTSFGGAGLFTLRVPGEVGVELLSPGRGFGFKVLARPWFEANLATAFQSGGAASAAVLGGGALLSLGWSGYLTK